MRCSIRGSSGDLEIPRLVMLFYLFHCAEPASSDCDSGTKLLHLCGCDLIGRHRQVGSLAGAAHLLKDNTGVLR